MPHKAQGNQYVRSIFPRTRKQAPFRRQSHRDTGQQPSTTKLFLVLKTHEESLKSELDRLHKLEYYKMNQFHMYSIFFHYIKKIWATSLDLNMVHCTINLDPDSQKLYVTL